MTDATVRLAFMCDSGGLGSVAWRVGATVGLAPDLLVPGYPTPGTRNLPGYPASVTRDRVLPVRFRGEWALRRCHFISGVYRTIGLRLLAWRGTVDWSTSQTHESQDGVQQYTRPERGRTLTRGGRNEHAIIPPQLCIPPPHMGDPLPRSHHKSHPSHVPGEFFHRPAGQTIFHDPLQASGKYKYILEVCIIAKSTYL